MERPTREPGKHAAAKPLVLHIIVGLGVGGAELTLLKICKGVSSFNHKVVSLTGYGALSKEFSKIGVEVIPLDFSNVREALIGLAEVFRTVRTQSPALVQSWLFHADLLTIFLKLRFPTLTVIWNLRHAELMPTHRLRTRVIQRVLAPCSWFVPTGIICAGEKVSQIHAQLGYRKKMMRVIPNGIDIRKFNYDLPARYAARSRLGLRDTTFLVGLFAKWDIQKGIEVFLDAIHLARQVNPAIHVLLVGDGLSGENHALTRLVHSYGLQNIALLNGPCSDVRELMNAADLIVSSSHTEGFPNVVAEAMACCKPVIATDVGESAALLGDANDLVAPGASAAISARLSEVSTLSAADRFHIGLENRKKIVSKYSLDEMLDAYAVYWTAKACTNS